MDKNIIKSLDTFRLNKKEITKAVENIQTELSTNPIGVACNLASLAEFVKQIKESLTRHVIKKMEATGMNTVRMGEFSVQKASTSRYDYSRCSYWNHLDAEKKRIEKLMKSISGPVTDEKTGKKITKAVKLSSSSFYKVIIPKD